MPERELYDIVSIAFLLVSFRAEGEGRVPKFDSRQDDWMIDPGITEPIIGEQLAAQLTLDLSRAMSRNFSLRVPPSVEGRDFESLSDDEVLIALSGPDGSERLAVTVSGRKIVPDSLPARD